LRELTKLYGNAKSDADVVIALGGDGLMLQTVHKTYKKGIPIFGMNRGSVGCRSICSSGWRSRRRRRSIRCA
jgi:NAD+ kinase